MCLPGSAASLRLPALRRAGRVRARDAVPAGGGSKLTTKATMTLDELRATKRDAILAIAARDGVSGICAFGSFARGEARNDGRLDLLIEAGQARSPFFPGGFPGRPGG
jgi:hypothetical protein